MNTIAVAPMRPRPTQNMPGDAAGAEGDLERRRQLSAARRGRGADVAAHGQAHPDEAGQAGEGGAAEEGDGPREAGLREGERDVPSGAHDLGGGEEDEHEQRDDDDRDGPELAAQEGVGAFLDRRGDLLHGRRALSRRRGRRASGKAPTRIATTPVPSAKTSHAFSVPPSVKAW